MNDKFIDIKKRLQLPVIQAPMFLVSGPDMVINACLSGIVGSFPASNARSLEQLEQWYQRISNKVSKENAPWAANVIVHSSNPRAEQELELIYQYQPEIVITALGSPKEVIDAVQAYGGLIFADVNSVRHARHAADSGVDGLVILCAGAGGYTGQLSPFAFVDEVRTFFDGILVLAGGINSGRNVRAAEVMGADLSYMGTHFLACEESMAKDDYKAMVVDAQSKDILVSDRVTGAAASFLVPSLIANGIDPKSLPDKTDFDFSKQLSGKNWKDLWSAGHGVSAVRKVLPIATICDELKQQYQQALR